MRWFSKLLVATLIALPIAANAQNLGPPAGGVVGIGSGVATQVSGLNPSGITSATSEMLGLGSSCTITPVNTTRIFFFISGELNGTVTAAQVIGHARFGTGTAPANGAAVTGTVVGSPTSGLVNPANWVTEGFAGGVVTGLTKGTTYWLDADLSATSGTGFLVQGQCTAFEF